MGEYGQEEMQYAANNASRYPENAYVNSASTFDVREIRAVEVKSASRPRASANYRGAR